MRAVLTDNGSCYRSQDWLKEVVAGGALPRRIRPYRPQTNGKVERLNRTLLDEWAYVRAYASEADRRRRLDSWLHLYNHHRCHTALGGHPPVTRVDNLAGHYNEATLGFREVSVAYQQTHDLGDLPRLEPGHARHLGTYAVRVACAEPHSGRTGWRRPGLAPEVRVSDQSSVLAVRIGLPGRAGRGSGGNGKNPNHVAAAASVGLTR